MVPPDPISNSEVKRSIADGSVEFLHVRVGHCWAFILKTPGLERSGVFYCLSFSGCLPNNDIFAIMIASYFSSLPAGLIPQLTTQITASFMRTFN